jgi:hypothetical protein
VLADALHYVLRKDGIRRSADSVRAKIPEDGRFAASALRLAQRAVDPTPVCARVKTPEGARFAVADQFRIDD